MTKEAVKKMYEDKASYVKLLNDTLAPITDFNGIEYARNVVTEEEFIKVVDEIGGATFVNVTGNSKSAILKEVCRMVLESTPTGLVRTIEAKREINKLFASRQTTC